MLVHDRHVLEYIIYIVSHTLDIVIGPETRERGRAARPAARRERGEPGALCLDVTLP